MKTSIFSIFVFFMAVGMNSLHAQILWNIDVNDKNQYESWEEVNGAKQKSDIELWGIATFKDGVLEMNLREGKDADFQSAFIHIIENYGQPSFFNDRNIQAEREKKRQDSIKAVIDSLKRKDRFYKPPKDTTTIPEDTRTVDELVADGDMILKRNWLLVDYEMELMYDEYGVRFRLKYLK